MTATASISPDPRIAAGEGAQPGLVERRDDLAVRSMRSAISKQCRRLTSGFGLTQLMS